MTHAPRALFVGALLLACPGIAAPSSESVKNETAELYRQATAAFGLGDYAEAAIRYEKAFALTPNHALLFNAALSHERAGNVERSRTLFANYLRLYAKGEKAEDARRHLENKPAKNEDKAIPSSDPPATEAAITVTPPSPIPAGTTPTTEPVSPVPPPGVVFESAEKAPPAPDPPPSPSFWKNPWVWGAGAVVVAGIVTTVILVSLPKSETTPLWGRI